MLAMRTKLKLIARETSTDANPPRGNEYQVEENAREIHKEEGERERERSMKTKSKSIEGKQNTQKRSTTK